MHVAFARPQMKLCNIWMGILFALLFTQSALSADYDSFKKMAIPVAKATPVSKIEAGKPEQPLEAWLQNLAGKDAKLEWGLDDCGESTGGPSDRERDMPLCVSVNAKLPDGRWLYVSLVVGQNSDIKRQRLSSVELWNVTAGYKDESLAFPRREEALTKLEEFMKVDAGNIGLYYAAAKGDVQAAQAFLKQGVDIHSGFGKEALPAAVKNGRIAVIPLLLDAGADVNVRLESGETVLSLTTWPNEKPEIAKLLLGRGVNASSINSAFMGAASRGHLEIAQLMLKAGADVNYSESQYHITPLMWASEYNKLEMMRLLLEAGANVNAVSTLKTTALSNCAGEGSVEGLLLLLEHGAEVRPKYATPPLSYAVDHGSVEKVRILIDHGADVNATDFGGFTPLMAVSKFGYLDVAKLLVEKSADLNLHDKDGNTALAYALKSHHPQIAKLLRKAGAKQ
jgi:ankyrin repeat protein